MPYPAPICDLYTWTTPAAFMEAAVQPNFFHGRYNDGEFDAILALQTHEHHHMNSNGCRFSPEVGRALQQVLLEYFPSDRYWLSGGVYWMRDSVTYRTLLLDLKQKNPKLNFRYVDQGDINVDVLAHPEYFHAFRDHLDRKKVVIIGPAYYQALKLFPHFELIEVSPHDAYQNYASVVSCITHNNATGEPTNYCVAAGFLSEPLIHHFAKEDSENSYYDIGSSWDYFFQSSPAYDWPRSKRRQWYFELLPRPSYRPYIV